MSRSGKPAFRKLAITCLQCGHRFRPGGSSLGCGGVLLLTLLVIYGLSQISNGGAFVSIVLLTVLAVGFGWWLMRGSQK